MKRRTTILTAALAVLGTAGPLAPTLHATSLQDPPATQPATAPIDLSDPAALARILHDPLSTPDQRDLAAARLLANGTAPAIDELARALRPSAPAPVQIAAALAVSGAGTPEPRLLDTLLALLASDGPVNVKREVGRALSTYRDDPAVVARLTEMAVARGSTPTRQGAVAGLARVPSKASAQALMLLLDGDAPEALERDAAEALRMVTGLDIAPDDLAGWQAWWEGVAQLDETAFKARLLDSGAAGAISNARRADSAAAALLAVSKQRFRSLAASDRPAMLEEYLQSAVPEMREVAALLVLEEADFGEDVAPGVMRLVRAGITDPSGRVRAIAAQIVQRRNDAAAVEPLLAQVGRETEFAARQAQIRALGSLRDPRALSMLLGLLTDPSPGVRGVAARSAADLANASGQPAVAQAAGAIRQAFLAIDPVNQSSQRQRVEMISALAELNDPSLATFYRDLLTGPTRPSRDVRAAALRGAATLGEEALSDTIVVYITDPDPKVREEAVKALVRSSRGFERADDIEELLNPRTESSDTVRQAAWRGLLELFPRAEIATLAVWADKFEKANQPDRQLAVLRVMAAKEEQSGNFEQLAWRRHEMADVLMASRPGEAADLFRQALQYSIDNAGTAGLIQTRAESALRAYIRARRFDEAITFARERINHDASFEEQVGRIVKQEAQTLTDQGQTDAARALIGAVLRQDPPLLARDRRSRQQLQEQMDSLPASAPADGP